MSQLSPAQRIEVISASGYPLAWDGCHKIYFLPDEESRRDAVEIGYHIHRATELDELVNSSCPLVFVSGWDNPGHPWNVEQGELSEVEES